MCMDCENKRTLDEAKKNNKPRGANYWNELVRNVPPDNPKRPDRDIMPDDDFDPGVGLSPFAVARISAMHGRGVDPERISSEIGVGVDKVRRVLYGTSARPDASPDELANDYGERIIKLLTSSPLLDALEIGRLLNIDPMVASKALEVLEQKGLADSVVRGNGKYKFYRTRGGQDCGKSAS